MVDKYQRSVEKSADCQKQTAMY